MKLVLTSAGLLVALCINSFAAADTATAEKPTQMADVAVRSLLKVMVNNAILPLYKSLDTQAQNLVKTSQAFCDKPTLTGLNNTRTDWAGVLSGWQQSSGLLFGPAVEDEIDFTIYFRPVKKAVIKGVLAGEGAIDLVAIEKAGVGGQGLATLEYLLFDRELSDEQQLSAFAASEPRRCDYLVSASALLAKNLHTISQGWAADGGNYGEALWTAGEGSAYFTETYQPVELLVNRLYQSVQAVEIKKLGVPLGVNGNRSGKPKAYPYKLEAWRSGYSLANINSTLQGLRSVLVDGGMLEWLKNNDHADLAQQLDQQLKALLSTQWQSTDLFVTLENKPKSVTPFYEQVVALSATVRKGLAPALGVQLGFNQNDGD